jgi:CRP/FNR family transcriptional regulator, cyclic AMP receptor protein
MIETKYLQENIKNIQILLSIPGLHNFEAQKLGSLLRLSRIRQYEPGEIIIKEGDDDPWFYFLLSGSVQIIKEGIMISKLEKTGQIFGEMRIIESRDRSASVYALEKTMCLAIDTSATERLHGTEERTDLLLFLYKIFAEYTSIRLRLTNDELIKCKKQLQSLASKSLQT